VASQEFNSPQGTESNLVKLSGFWKRTESSEAAESPRKTPSPALRTNLRHSITPGKASHGPRHHVGPADHFSKHPVCFIYIPDIHVDSLINSWNLKCGSWVHMGSPEREEACSFASSRYVLYLESTIVVLHIDRF
jgi:hypothetical protein